MPMVDATEVSFPVRRAVWADGGLASHIVADGAIVAVIVVWWFGARHLPAFVLPTPQATAEALLQFAVDPVLAASIVVTALRVALSLAAAVAIGTALATLAYYMPVTRDIVRLRIMPVLNAMPSLGWALLAAVWFGISNTSVVFAQTMILVPFCFVNVSEGIDAIDAELLEMGCSFTRRRGRVFRKVVFPAVAPYLVAAARLAYGVSWKVALIAELFGADSGLGYAMYQAQMNSDPAMVIATCLVIVILFTLGDALLLRPLYRLASPQREQPDTRAGLVPENGRWT